MWARFRIEELERLHRPPSSTQFGVTMAVIGAVLLALMHQWVWLLIPGVILTIALWRPHLLDLPNRIWFIFGLFLGWLMSPIILSLFYFLVFSPMAIAVKLFGHKSFVHRGWVQKKKACDFTRNF